MTQTPRPAATTHDARRHSAAQSGAAFDELLVVLVQQGDKAALERLYARWHPRLARAALRYTGDAELARDLVQECWIGIWKGIGRLSHPAQFRSFAFTVLNRRGADHLRTTIRDRAATTIMRAEDMPESPVAATQDDGLAIAQAFAALPPDQRLAAHLHFVEGLALSEIAAVQNIAEGTAKTRLFHARRKLKAALSQSTPLSTQGVSP